MGACSSMLVGVGVESDVLCVGGGEKKRVLVAKLTT